jgi:hypothetical protein
MAVLGGRGAQQEGDGVERKMGKREESIGLCFDAKAVQRIKPQGRHTWAAAKWSTAPVGLWSGGDMA